MQYRDRILISLPLLEFTTQLRNIAVFGLKRFNFMFNTRLATMAVI